MRVGLSTSVIEGGHTGIGRYVFGLTRAFLNQAGVADFSLFVLEEDLPLFDFARQGMRLVPVSERFRAPLKNIFWHQTQLPRLVRELQLDVVHIPSYRRLLGPHPCGLVATIHDLAPFRLPGKYDALRMFYGRVVARWLARRQDEIIAVSNTTGQDAIRFFRLPPRRVTVIHNGIDHQQFFPDCPRRAKVAVAERYGVTAPFFLYVARLEHPGKNHVRLITAFDRFKAETRSPWRLVLAGSNWSRAESIHAAIRRSPFAREIHRLGFVAEADLPALLRAADVFVYPSLHEGFGLPPLEAMACACPVLCSTRGALGEVVGGAAVTVDPENIIEMQQQLTRLAADAALRERLQAEGLARVRQFDWETNAAATLRIYARARCQTEARNQLPARFYQREANACAAELLDSRPRDEVQPRPEIS